MFFIAYFLLDLSTFDGEEGGEVFAVVLEVAVHDVEVVHFGEGGGAEDGGVLFELAGGEGARRHGGVDEVAFAAFKHEAMPTDILQDFQKFNRRYAVRIQFRAEWDDTVATDVNPPHFRP